MRILFVSARPPWPVRRGDQARLAGWLEALAPRHELAALTLVPPGFAVDPSGEEVMLETVGHGRLAQLASLVRHPRSPLQVAMHRSAALGSALDRTLERFAPEVVVAVLSRIGWIVERTCGVPVVVDLVDSLAMNLERRARREPLLAPLLGWESRRMRAWDRRLVAACAGACVVSEDDRQAIVDGAPELSDRLAVVPFGLELPDVPPERSEPAAPVVLLSGNLGYFPTVDAAVTFAREVWPKVRSAVPDAAWWLAGARPARAVRRLDRLPGVKVLADPDDLGAIRRRATLAIAPLRAGSGTPIKILEAMADGLPVVSTPAGARGLDGLPEGAVAVADGPDDQARAVVDLLRQPAAGRSPAAAAFAWLRERHDLASVADRFERQLAAALRRS